MRKLTLLALSLAVIVATPTLRADAPVIWGPNNTAYLLNSGGLSTNAANNDYMVVNKRGTGFEIGWTTYAGVYMSLSDGSGQSLQFFDDKASNGQIDILGRNGRWLTLQPDGSDATKGVRVAVNQYGTQTAPAFSVVNATLAQMSGFDVAGKLVLGSASAPAAELDVNGATWLRSYTDLTEIAKPAAPAAGAIRLYSKSGDGLYFQTPGGVETQLGANGPTLAYYNSQGTLTTAGNFFSTTIPANTFKDGDLFTESGGFSVTTPNSSNYYTVTATIGGQTLFSGTTQTSSYSVIPQSGYMYQAANKIFVPTFNSSSSSATFPFDATIANTVAVSVTLTGAPTGGVELNSFALSKNNAGATGAQGPAGPAGTGSGTVTSVAMTVPSFLSVAGSPVTTSGTLAVSLSGTALPITNGGTGLSTLTANNVLVGAGTSAPTFVAPGANGNVLTSNGTTWTSTASTAFTVKVPTIQKFTSGSGTYTTTAGTTWIRVRCVGGGGGGAGGGNTSIVNGGAGGTTTFGTTLISCGGGAGGITTYYGAIASGGTASLGTGPIGLAVPGADGITGAETGSGGGFDPTGGAGAASAFGGGGGTQLAGAGTAGNAGGGGGGGGISTGNNPGGGGAAGGFVDAIITSPSATYAYAVGAGGAAGAAGTGGFVGGAGGGGVIIVEEHAY